MNRKIKLAIIERINYHRVTMQSLNESLLKNPTPETADAILGQALILNKLQSAFSDFKSHGNLNAIIEGFIMLKGFFKPNIPYDSNWNALRWNQLDHTANEIVINELKRCL